MSQRESGAAGDPFELGNRLQDPGFVVPPSIVSYLQALKLCGRSPGQTSCQSLELQ